MLVIIVADIEWAKYSSHTHAAKTLMMYADHVMEVGDKIQLTKSRYESPQQLSNMDALRYLQRNVFCERRPEAPLAAPTWKTTCNQQKLLERTLEEAAVAARQFGYIYLLFGSRIYYLGNDRITITSFNLGDIK